MKKYILLLSLLMSITAFAQKREKLKGSKIVSVSQRELQLFTSLEVEDNLEVFLIKGKNPALEIEADDNVHDAIMADNNGGALRLYTSKEISRTKKLSVRVVYTDSLQSITAKHEVILNALANLEVSKITIKNLDYSQSYLNVRAGDVTLVMDDKTHGEVNLKAENTTVELSKNAYLKALIACPAVKFDMYQKTEAEIEGDTENLKLRIDNEASFTGKRFTAKNMALTAEGYTWCSVLATDTITIGASGEAKVELYGKPATVGFSKFTDTATIYKKEL